MASAPRMSNLAARAALDAITLLCNAGGGGKVEVFNHTVLPATCEAADLGTKLAILPLTADGFPDSSDGTDKATVDAAAITDEDSALAALAPTYFRIKDGLDVCIMQGSAGGPASGEDCEFDKTPFVLADVVKIVAGGLTLTLSEV